LSSWLPARGSWVQILPGAPEFKKFELAVNVKTAKALDIAIAQSLLLRADEAIR